MNDRIRAREIRVIDADGAQLGVITPQDALRKAREQNLDLVEISPSAVPPVCRIMDYGKFLYEQEKKDRAAKKHQKQIVLKEVKFSVNVDEHDYVTKRNHVLRFLSDGDKVKASLRFRGREMAHQNLRAWKATPCTQSSPRRNRFLARRWKSRISNPRPSPPAGPRPGPKGNFERE